VAEGQYCVAAAFSAPIRWIWYFSTGEPIAKNGLIKLSDHVPDLALETDEAELARSEVIE
jgi:hypothetical protein